MRPRVVILEVSINNQRETRVVRVRICVEVSWKCRGLEGGGGGNSTS